MKATRAVRRRGANVCVSGGGAVGRRERAVFMPAADHHARALPVVHDAPMRHHIAAQLALAEPAVVG
eukprot:1217183-Prymnesium_polylepis.1